MANEPTYIQPAQIDELLDDGSEATAGETRLAEEDTDAQIYGNTYYEDTGRKLDPSKLTPKELDFLGRAVAAQVRYRRLNGPGSEFFELRDYKELTTEGFSRRGNRRPKYSDKAKDYLRRGGFLQARGIGSKYRTLTGEIRDYLWERF